MHAWHSSIRDEHERLARKYGDLGGELLLLELPAVQNGGGLGISLSGNRDLNRMSVFVCGIRNNSSAALDGRLKVGDELLEVNDHVLYGRSHLNAAPIIRNCYQSARVKLVVHRDEDNLTAMAVRPPVEIAADQGGEREPVLRRNSNLITTGATDPMHYPGSQRKGSSVSLCHVPSGAPFAIEETHAITLIKSGQGLGFAIMEGSFTDEPGIYVKHITPNGPASQDGNLRPGDRLLQVDQHNVSGASYDCALDWLRATKNQVHLLVGRIRCGVRGDGNSSMHVSPGRVVSEGAADHRLHHSHLSATGNGVDSMGMAAHYQKRLSAPQIITTVFGSSDSTSGVKLAAIQLHADVTLDDAFRSEPDQKPGTATPPSPVPDSGETIEPAVTPAESPSRKLLVAATVITPTPSSQTSRRTSLTTAGTGAGAHLLSVTAPDHQPGTCPILTAVETEIELERGSGPLGLAVIGGSDTFLGIVLVHEIYEAGAAARDGRLRSGDQLLRINGVDMRSASHATAQAALLQSSGSKLMLRVLRKDSGPPREDEMYDLVVVELTKKPNKGLGLSIVGRSGGAWGVYIGDVVKGGAAESDGRLRPGDQLLEVNGESVRTASQEVVATKLKSMMGRILLKVGRLTNSTGPGQQLSHGTGGGDAGTQDSAARRNTPSPRLRKGRSPNPGVSPARSH